MVLYSQGYMAVVAWKAGEAHAAWSPTEHLVLVLCRPQGDAAIGPGLRGFTGGGHGCMRSQGEDVVSAFLILEAEFEPDCLLILVQADVDLMVFVDRPFICPRKILLLEMARPLNTDLAVGRRLQRQLQLVVS